MGNIIVTMVGWVMGIFFTGLMGWLIWNFLIKDVIATIKQAKKNLPKSEDQTSRGGFCSNCGNKLNPESNFCGSCGRRI